MSRFIAITLSAILLFNLFGCTYWYQQGKSFEDCREGLSDCYYELKKHVDRDYIQLYEVEFVQTCMEQKGYKLVTEDKLPTKVKRRDPEMDVFWLLAGVAGTLEQ